jgi:hypothetical protein
MSYHSLDPAKIIDTIGVLRNRIEERFPGSGLGKVCGDILDIANRAHERSKWIARPLYWLRIITAVGISVIVGGLATFVILAGTSHERFQWEEPVQMLEAGINDVLLIGAAIFFLTTIERRIKRGRALAAIHELRSVAHIIDMHQLTKDPERLLGSSPKTVSSPRAGMSLFELRRYLDYCSEMLSLVGKIATLYVQRFDDDVSLAAASEVEELTTGLSQKIWQKIMILHSFEQRGSYSGGTESNEPSAIAVSEK